jgi:hypothetical protein
MNCEPTEETTRIHKHVTEIISIIIKEDGHNTNKIDRLCTELKANLLKLLDYGDASTDEYFMYNTLQKTDSENCQNIIIYINSVKKPAKEVVKESAKEVVKESVKEPIKEVPKASLDEEGRKIIEKANKTALGLIENATINASTIIENANKTALKLIADAN